MLSSYKHFSECAYCVMFKVHVWNVLCQLQCRLAVSSAILWLRCQSLADQTVPILGALPQFFQVLHVVLVNAVLQNHPRQHSRRGLDPDCWVQPQTAQTKFASADGRSPVLMCSMCRSPILLENDVLIIIKIYLIDFYAHNICFKFPKVV